MGIEQSETSPIKLRLIQMDLKQRSLLLVAEDYSATRLILSSEGILYETFVASTTSLTHPLTERSVEKLAAEAQPTRDKDSTVTVTGRLKTQPKEGSPDSRGRPTATARLAYHQEGSPEAQFYFATFHGGTREIALKLPVDAPITVLGYARP